MTILVPIDPTAPSRAAVRLAGMLALEQDHDLVLLHAAMPRPSLETLAALHRIAEPLRAQGVGVRLRTVAARPAEAICREATRRDCAWVVMGTRGTADTEDSLAMQIMGCSPVPVIAVRPGTSDATLPVGWVSRSRDLAFELASTWAASLGSPLRRLRAATDGGPPLVDFNGDETTVSDVIIDFDPRCDTMGWCAKVLREVPGTVLLVGSEHCGCETSPA